jgi:DNA-binding transcriptional ArsR family regulator
MAGGGAPYAYLGLDRLAHERARLGIVSSLAGRADGLGFSELKALCALTDGNLNRHLAVLEEAGVVALNKGYEGERPHTRCHMTEAGAPASPPTSTRSRTCCARHRERPSQGRRRSSHDRSFAQSLCRAKQRAKVLRGVPAGAGSMALLIAANASSLASVVQVAGLKPDRLYLLAGATQRFVRADAAGEELVAIPSGACALVPVIKDGGA